MRQSNTSAVAIDGAHGEGGGQVLRTSLSLSALTGRPVEIARIRAGRSRPGLMAQHLAAVRAVAAVCAAHLEGAEIGSQRLRFSPQSSPVAGDYQSVIGTAGAVSLVAQTVLLPLARANAVSHVSITGGTHVPHAPTADYLERVYLPTLERLGLAVSCLSPRAGFFPKGGGQIQIRIEAGSTLQPVSLTERGELRRLTALATTAQLPASVAARGLETVQQEMADLRAELLTETRDVTAHSPGAAIFLLAECEVGLTGFSVLGERGKRIENVASEACQAFRAWWRTGAACEEHLTDQLVLPLALTPGESCWTTSLVTEHLRTVLWVIPQFLPADVSLTENPDGSGRIILRVA